MLLSCAEGSKIIDGKVRFARTRHRCTAKFNEAEWDMGWLACVPPALWCLCGLRRSSHRKLRVVSYAKQQHAGNSFVQINAVKLHLPLNSNSSPSIILLAQFTVNVRMACAATTGEVKVKSDGPLSTALGLHMTKESQEMQPWRLTEAGSRRHLTAAHHLFLMVMT